MSSALTVNSLLQSKLKAKNSLSGVLGDAYLIKNNPIYAQVRTQVKGFKYKFVPAEKAQGYTEWPLMYLQTILKSKKIPYYQNQKALGLLKNKNLTIDELMDCPPFGNYILHESCHCLVDHIWSQKKDLTYYLFAESCASACEAMSHIFVEDLEHEFYLSFNNYLKPGPTDIKAMREIFTRFSPEALLEFLICLYLYANHAQGPISKAEIKSIWQILHEQDLASKDLALLSRLAVLPTRLSQKFTSETTLLYLKAQGFSEKQVVQQRAKSLPSVISAILPEIRFFSKISLPEWEQP